MKKFDRPTLKDKFKSGNMPSEHDFGSLIDSMINVLEEGFDKTSEDGLKIAQLAGSSRLISFYEHILVDSPRWFMAMGIGDNKLHFGTLNTPHVLTLRSYEEDDNGQLKPQVAVGINKEVPQVALDVEGTVASSGRRGQPGDIPVLADGNWHDITSGLTGCQAFEVVAGVGGQDTKGQYALLHAIALNAFNGKSSIEQQHSHFGNKCNRIELRWLKAPHLGQFHFILQMRTQCPYFKNAEDKIWVKYHITQLWFDTLMLDNNREHA